MQKDDWILASIIGLVVLYYVVNYVLMPVVGFINWVPGGWLILATMFVGGRYVYLTRNRDENVVKTMELRKWLSKTTNGRYVYNHYNW